MTRRQDIVPGVLELDLDAIDPIAGVICGARTWGLHEGDALELWLPPECADAAILDLPAGIKFMGAAWDGDKGGMDQWVAYWGARLKVVYDALKPGAHLAAWSLPRTSHWTALAIERAGFEIRDTIDHISGGGFPKSLDISRAIDAAAGASRDVIGPGAYAGRGRSGANQVYGAATSSNAEVVTAPATPEARRWAGFGTALRPNKEVWWLARKPLAKGHTIAANVLRYGVGGINVDAGRVATDWSERPDSWKRSGHSANPEADKIAAPPGNGIDCNPAGRWPSNCTFAHSSWDESECRACGVVVPFVVRHCPACGSGDVELMRGGCRCVGERRVATGTTYEPTDARPRAVRGAPDWYLGRVVGYADEDGLETVDAWECLATCERCGVSALVPSGGDLGRCGCGFARRWACAVALLDEQSGCRTSGARAAGAYQTSGFSGGWAANGEASGAIERSSGTASRFYHCFPPEPLDTGLRASSSANLAAWHGWVRQAAIEPPPFLYSAKPATSEREQGLDALPKRSAGAPTGREDGSAGTKSPRAGAGRTAEKGRANTHPTVKGFHLIGHLCDLLVPPGGLVLDLTAGSGTLGAVVAHRHHVTGWRCIMAEIDPEHCRIIRERCKHWGARPWRPRKRTAAKPVAQAVGQTDLFGGEGA